MIAAHLSSLSFVPVFVIHSASLSTHGIATFQLGPHGPRDPMVYGRFLVECVWTQTTLIDEPLHADNRSDRMTTAPTAIHSGSIQLQRRLPARYPSDPRIMRAAPTQFRRAVVIAHFQQTRPLVAEKLAHLWQRETGHSVRHSDIQFGTMSSKLAHSWQREMHTTVPSIRRSVRDSGAVAAALVRHAATVFSARRSGTV